MKSTEQQFNKYLSGTVYPSRHNLERICRFFDVDQESINQTEKEFRQKQNSRLQADADDARTRLDINEWIDTLPNSIDLLERYKGYYYSHFHALGYPGYLARSLIHLYRHEDRFYTKSVEHLWDKELETSHHHRFKYRGLALYLADRIFLTEHETLTRQVVCHTILYPNYHNNIDYLSGITIGVSSLNAHVPKATRVEYQYLGESIDLRNAINGCGLFSTDSTAIIDRIRERISNDIAPDEYMLTARGQ
ncbi:hypothetical protein [Candidatus Spongiihabitans sp.]|uniref:hypothetical protein n=1 Tax=Candidatus Spongiihabitans sp. TaxID=3101308 RepID=UPI003C6ECE58